MAVLDSPVPGLRFAIVIKALLRVGRRLRPAWRSSRHPSAHSGGLGMVGCCDPPNCLNPIPCPAKGGRTIFVSIG